MIYKYENTKNLLLGMVLNTLVKLLKVLILEKVKVSAYTILVVSIKDGRKIIFTMEKEDLSGYM